MKGTILVLLVTFGGSVGALFNPFIGALLYIGLALLRPEYLWGISVRGSGFVSGVALLLGWALHGFGNWRFGRAWPVVAGIIAFWLWALISAVFADVQAVAWPFVVLLTKTVLAVLVAATTVKTTRQMKILVWLIVIIEGYIAWEMNLSYFQGYNRAEDDGFGDMGRAVFAISLVTAFWPAVALTLTSKRRWQQAIAALCALFIFHTILLTFSRGGMLGLLVSSVVAFVLLRKRSAHYVVAIIALLIAFRLTGVEVAQRFASTFASVDERDPSADSRVKLWGSALTLVIESPIVGVGPDGFGYKAPRFGWPLGKEAHSLWVQTAAELGLPALGFLVVFYVGGLPRLVRIARSLPTNEEEEWQSRFAWATVASLVGFVTAAQFVSVVRMEASYYVTVIGAVVVALRSSPAFQSLPEGQASTSAPAVPVPTWQGAAK